MFLNQDGNQDRCYGDQDLDTLLREGPHLDSDCTSLTAPPHP